MNFVFTLGVEAAQAIEASQPGAGVSGFGVNRHRTERYDVTIHDFELGWISVFDAREFEEVAEAEAIAVHLHSRHRFEQRDLFSLEQIGATNEDTTRPVEQSRFARRHRCRQHLVAQLLHVRERMHVENHQIAADSLEPPIVVRPQQLTHTRHSDLTVDRCQKNRPVPGYAERPQGLLAKPVLFDRALRWPESWMRKHQVTGKVLIQRRVSRSDSQIPEFRLRLSP